MNRHQQGQITYGELVILGYNGRLPDGDRGRKRSKFILKQRPLANGIKPVQSNITNIPEVVNQDNKTHRITYVLSKSTAMVVEYEKDDNSDMFQIGRSADAAIDFVVLDTCPGQKKQSECPITVSRFACRILIDRRDSNDARIYAGGFDNGKNVFLGEKAIKWKKDNDTMDGLTTNGVLIAQPINGRYSYWREVSVGGDIYSLRDKRNSNHMGIFIKNENNVLKDGTLINLCGATLLWRSADGLSKSPDKYDVQELVGTINNDISPNRRSHSNCLVIPRKLTSTMDNIPYAYTECGHVHRFRRTDLERTGCSNKCSRCQVQSSIIKLCMGMEPAFYMDYGPPTFAFNPCGHMATEKTIKHWIDVGIPHGLSGYISMCPFCAIHIDGSPGYVKLIF